jgi:hypothetical protein
MAFHPSYRFIVVGFAITIGLASSPADRVWIGPAAAVGDDFFAPAEGRLGRPSESNSPKARFREGSRLATTVGRFIKSDNHWYFHLEKPIGTAQSNAKNGPQPLSDNGKPSADAARESSGPPSASATLDRLIVLENLALQRVAQTIMQDPTDDRWAISGVITEYFDENRVLISTAVRAPLAVDSSR